MTSIIYKGKQEVVGGGDDVSKVLRADLKLGIEITDANLFNRITTISGGILATNAYRAGSYYSVQASSNSQFGNKDWSIACLLKPSITGTSGFLYNIILANDRFNAGKSEIILFLFKNNTVNPVDYRLSFSVGTGTSFIYSSGTPYINNEWSLFVVNHIASTKTIEGYLNNSLVSSDVYLGDFGVSGDPLWLGARDAAGYFDGICTNTLVQYVYKWDRVLTSEERNYLWNDGDFSFA